MADTLETPIVASPPASVRPDLREVEMVERKGRGRPDSISDAVAEAFSIALSRYYHERTGSILHHNVDKVLLAAGSSAPRLGGGEVVAPFEIYLGGRATQEIDGVPVPAADIAEQTSRTWLRANLHAINVDRHVRVRSLVRPGSAALSALVARRREPARANDASIAVGYAPPSPLERIVLAVEETLTAASTVAAHPMIGEDVKGNGRTPRRPDHPDHRLRDRRPSRAHHLGLSRGQGDDCRCR